MDHSQSVARKASERYLLEEMSEPERFAFEEHYFDCEECAEDVRVGAAMARGIHAVGTADASRRAAGASQPEAAKSRWTGWAAPSWLVPSFAGGAFAVLAAYQAIVIIPPMREARLVAPVVLRAAARGDEPTVTIDSRAGISVLAMDVNSGDPGRPLTWEILSPDGTTAIKGDSQVPPPGSQLMLLLPKGKIDRAGAWTMTIRTAQGEIGRYPFKVELN